MNIFLQIWRNIPSIIALMLPLFINHYYRKIDSRNETIREEAERSEKLRIEEERKHNDRERRIQWTLEAYTRLYDTALNNLENFGTKKEILERSLKRQDKEYKQLRSYIDRIETFAKGFGLTGGQEIYDMETFKQISSPYFGLHVKPRVEAFFESAGSSENAYIDTKMLLKKI